MPGTKKKTSTCAERLLSASTAHNRLLKRGGFTRCQLLLGHEPEQPEGEPLDPEREGLDLTSYVAERHVRQQSAYEAWHEAEAEHRVSRAQNVRLRNHQHWREWYTSQLEWRNWHPLKEDGRARKTKNTFLGLRWCTLSRAGTSTRKWRPLRGSRLDCRDEQTVATGARTLDTALEM